MPEQKEALTTEEEQRTKAQTQQQQPEQAQVSLNSSSSSLSLNSISLIVLDELSSFDATKQSRLPALIKLNSSGQTDLPKQPSSMPSFTADHLLEQSQQQQVPCSLPNQVRLDAAEASPKLAAQDGSQPMVVASEQQQQEPPVDKENEADLAESFQVVDMVSADLMGPSLPQAPQSVQEKQGAGEQRSALVAANQQTNRTTTSSAGSTNGHPSHLGDSLIEMIVNLKNENQNLVRALETNNEYVKERLSEFKRVNEESKRREAQFAVEKADQEHQVRKLQRQNMVLSERLKSMEAKLKDMKLEIGESLQAANSSKASSVREESNANNLYPTLGEPESFSNLTSQQQQQAVTMQVGEDEHEHDESRSEQPTTFGSHSPTAPPMETDSFRPARQPATSGQPIAGTSNATESLRTEPMRVGAMSKEELSKRFDADKAQFYAMDDDPMKECDKLEQQLNDIGKRDYEICLLQQQLNIYRQDFRLERMANLEAKLQIERLKTDIDRLCLDRLNEKRAEEDARGGRHHHGFHRGHHRSSAGAAVEGVMGKLGHHLSKKAAKSAAKAAKYASKQAHRDEKAMAAAAAAAAAAASAGSGAAPSGSPPGGASSNQSSGGHRRHHSHLHGLRTVRSEVVNDLMSTANKAMLTGYKMASTHVNLALDKLSQFEQSQASHLAQNKQLADGKAATSNNSTTQPMRPPSVD